jgi:hypothetical protein
MSRSDYSIEEKEITLNMSKLDRVIYSIPNKIDHAL